MLRKCLVTFYLTSIVMTCWAFIYVYYIPTHGGSYSSFKGKYIPSRNTMENRTLAVYRSNTEGVVPMFTRHMNMQRSWHLDKRALTSAHNTHVELVTPKDQLVVGKFITLIVTTFNNMGKPRSRGGDFWFATLHNMNNSFSTAGRISDLNNGTYDIQFFLGFGGDLILDLYLVYTGESIDWIREVYRPDEYCFLWWGIYRVNNGPVEKTKCRVKRGGPFPLKCEYGRGSMGMGETVFTCDKASTIGCNDLKSIESDQKTNAISKPVDRLLRKYNMTYLFKRPFYQEKVLTSQPIRVSRNTLPHPNLTENLMKPCQSGFSKKPKSSGYWESESWKSLECKTKRWSTNELHRALNGYEVYLIGDSTVEQWYISLNNRLGLAKFSPNGRMYFNQKYQNFTIYFHYNRLPVSLGKRIPIKHVMDKFEPEILDDLSSNPGCKYIIMLGHWAHYGAWTEDTYRDHMFYIKEAIVRLRKRCSDVKVAIRSTHPRDHKIFQTRVQSNHWVFWDMNRILREIYENVDVHFIDVWDLALSYPSPHDVHMPMPCVNEMVDLVFSHIFPLSE